MTIAETLPIPNEFDDDNDFWPHPIYTNYEANRNGIVRHIKKEKLNITTSKSTNPEPI